jgi:hypothetical protein
MSLRAGSRSKAVAQPEEKHQARNHEQDSIGISPHILLDFELTAPIRNYNAAKTQ